MIDLVLIMLFRESGIVLHWRHQICLNQSENIKGFT